MLSFDITHRLTDLLIAIESTGHHHARVRPALTVVLATPRGATPWLYTEPVPVPDHAWHQPGGTVAVLSTLAAALRCPAGTRLLARAYQERPADWVLAYAVAYQCQGWARPVRMLDAVDTDERLYRISRSTGDGQVGLSVHDDREAGDPPTRAALTDLLTATHTR